MKKILVLDNYDSFTYNLVHYIESVSSHNVDVFRNNKISLDEINGYDMIVLSPGPGLPKDAGIMPELIKEYHSSKKILGICLGHQAIAEFFGAQLFNLDKVYHGISTKVNINNSKLVFKNLPEQIDAGRYHSWAVAAQNFPEELELTATDENGIVMAFEHKRFPITGIQFHPESILTPHGRQMIQNWIKA